MKLPILTLVAAGLFSLPLLLRAEDTVALQTSTPAVTSALTDIISQQLAAFRAGDFPKAYTFASKEIQGVFPLDAFKKMVKSNYPVMVQAARTDFRAALDDGTIGVVFVQLTPEGGKTLGFRYMLKHEAAGWRITGVEQVEQTPAHAPITA